jgi:hypothetical protein
VDRRVAQVCGGAGGGKIWLLGEFFFFVLLLGLLAGERRRVREYRGTWASSSVEVP